MLLRTLVGVTAIGQGGAFLASSDDPTSTMWVIGLLAIGSGASMLIGFITSAAGVVAGLTIILVAASSLAVPSSASLGGVGVLCVVTVAAALVLLGPGAISLDARLFGRREIVFPHDSHPPRY